MLKLNNVSKSFGKLDVLTNVNLNFSDPHGVYGLLGRNGVGKTTLMMMIANQIIDYTGDITLDNTTVKENDELLSNIILFGNPINDNNLLMKDKLIKVVEFYDEAINSFDHSLMSTLMHTFNLDPKTKFEKLSTGNKTLFTNSLALASRMPITLIDEPTNGLDSVNRQQFFRNMMDDYVEHPRMFIISTHLIAEVENYLTHAIMLKENNVLLSEPIENIQEKGYRITNYDVLNKNIIAKQTIAGILVTDIYDDISEEERRQIVNSGGKVESLNLQDLFNGLLGGEHNE